MIVLDASVLVAHLDADDAHHEAATALLLREAGEPLAASPLTLAETLVGPARAGILDRSLGALRRMNAGSAALADDAPARLALLRATLGLRLPDCCVLLAAEQSRGRMATFDERLAEAGRTRGLEVLER